jgi:tetratricopeptide (TPR) repeat protein
MRLFIFCLFIQCSLYGQAPNCNVFLWNKDTLQYTACKLIEDIQLTTYQFHSDFLYPMQKAIKICPYFAYPYREIGAPYVKAGNFVEWKKYIDKAVEYDPLSYLHVRASLRYKFFADYKGTLEDIEKLEELMQGDIGITSNGTYHLNIVKGLCYKALGNRKKAIEIIERQILQGDNYFNTFDYLHLGVLYLEEDKIEDGLKYFEMQSNNYEMAENQFYIALCYKKIHQYKTALIHLERAKKLFENETRMYDKFNELFDQIYLSDIEREIDIISKHN